MKKVKSVGVVYTDGEKFLAVTSYGSGKVGLPKGIVDKDEKYINTAQREFFEETGLRLPKSNLKYLGEFFYMKHKDLILFKYKVLKENVPVPIEVFMCLSYFKDKKGKLLPEIETYKYINIDNYTELDHNYHKIFKELNEKKLLK